MFLDGPVLSHVGAHFTFKEIKQCFTIDKKESVVQMLVIVIFLLCVERLQVVVVVVSSDFHQAWAVHQPSIFVCQTFSRNQE